MVEKLEVTIDVIVHATEEPSKFFESFEEMFGLDSSDFSIQHTTGHFENPITILSARLAKEQASKFVEKLIESISKEQLDQMVSEIEERTVDSRYHIRIDKQELVNKKIAFNEKDAVKIKIHTPVYNKKDTVKTFTKIFQDVT
ncbi:MAG: exosome protein [Nitrosarchaeum sp.]|nr:exosome protein [Nitrosarchaeum sp.]